MSNAIQQTYELFKDLTKWTRGAYARDRHGRAVDSKNQNACRWCFYGAMKKFDASSEEFSLLREIITKKYPEHKMISLNDKIGYEAVIEILKKALDIPEKSL